MASLATASVWVRRAAGCGVRRSLHSRSCTFANAAAATTVEDRACRHRRAPFSSNSNSGGSSSNGPSDHEPHEGDSFRAPHAGSSDTAAPAAAAATPTARDDKHNNPDSIFYTGDDNNSSEVEDDSQHSHDEYFSEDEEGGPEAKYVDENDPEAITKDGTYFKLPHADMKAYFPEGVAGYLKHEFDYASLRDNRAIMHREPARSIISHMKRLAAGDSAAQRAFLIRGERGTGKSAALNHAVHYARTHGWIVLFVPKARELLRTGIYCTPTETGPEGHFDTPVHAQRMLVDLLAAHGPALKALAVSDPELLQKYGEHAKTGPGGTLSLFDIAQPGLPAGTDLDNDAVIEAEAAADGCFTAVLGELMRTRSANVLLAVDEYSELFQPSQWRYKLDEQLAEIDLDDPDYEELMEERRNSMKLEVIPPQRLTVVAPFLFFQPQEGPDGVLRCDPAQYTPVNGMVIAAASENYPLARKVKGHRGLWPRFEERFKDSAEQWTVRTPRRYTEEEYWSVMDHYRQCDMIDPNEVSLEMMQRIAVKSARNPKLVFHKCSFHSFG